MARKKTDPEEIKAIEPPSEDTGEIVPFRIIQGGRQALDPKEPPYDDTWLSKLPLGTLFYVYDRHNHMNYIASFFRITDKMEGITLLEYQSEKGNQEVPVINTRFCNTYGLQLIRGKYIEE